MASRAPKEVKTEISQLFYIPDGMQDLVYSEADNINFDPNEYLDIEVLDDTDDEDKDSPPHINKIISQTIRRAANGNKVVDLVFDVDDLAGKQTYQYRVVKRSQLDKLTDTSNDSKNGSTGSDGYIIGTDANVSGS